LSNHDKRGAVRAVGPKRWCIYPILQIPTNMNDTITSKRALNRDTTRLAEKKAEERGEAALGSTSL
jgi:hypothetical protein